MQSSKYINGALYCLIATLSWGTMFPVMTHALTKIDPFTFTALRYTLAGLIFVYFLAKNEGVKSFSLDGQIFKLWFFGSAGFAGFGMLVFLGQQMAGPSGALSTSIMMATMPLLGLLVNWVLRGVKPPVFSFFFILMSFSGVLLVMTKGNLSLLLTAPVNFKANILMILGALCWVLYTIGATYFPKWSPIRYTALSTLLGLPTIYLVTAILLGTNYITLPSISAVGQSLPELIYMAFIAGFVGVLCSNKGNKIITPMNGVLFMDIVPITAFVISALEGVTATPGQIIGVLLTVTALALNNIIQRKGGILLFKKA